MLLTIIPQSDDAFPDGHELLQRILRKYRPVKDAGKTAVPPVASWSADRGYVRLRDPDCAR